MIVLYYGAVVVLGFFLAVVVVPAMARAIYFLCNAAAAWFRIQRGMKERDGKR